MNLSIPPELMTAYSETVISIQIDDLNSLIIRGSNSKTIAADFQDSFGENIQDLWVITAENPYSEQLSPDENFLRQQSLLTELSERGIDVLDALCSSPDGSWSELSFAVPVNTELVKQTHELIHQLARDFGQNAVFKISPTVLSVISTLGDYQSDKSEVLFETNYSIEHY